MIFLLVFLLMLLLFFVVLINNYDIMSPPVWVVTGFFISAVGGALNYSIWGDISDKTVGVIVLSIAPFILGAVLGKRIRLKTNVNLAYRKRNVQNDERHLGKILVFVMNIIMLVTAVLYLQFMYQNSLIGGNYGGWQHMFSFARIALAGEDALNMGIGLSFLLKLCFGFAYVQTYIVIRDIVYHGYKSVNILDACSVFLFLIHAILSGGRTKMLYYVVFITTVASVLSRHKHNWDKASKSAGFKYIILGVFLGLAFFWGIDKTVRGSVYGTNFELWDQFSKYISSPIYALDVFLKDPTQMKDFAETETLYPLISIMNKLGANIPFTNNALEFVSYGNTETVITNIYTAIRRYIHDYGYIGLCLLMFLQGIIYNACYATIKARRIQGIKLLLYGILVYPVAFYFIEERFLNDLFTLTMLFQLICIVLFWNLAKKKIDYGL